MEKDQRTALRTAVVSSRRLLEKEFQEQLEGTYNILPDGRVLENAPGDPIVRARLLDVIQHHRAGGATAAEAVDRVVRKAAFTVLNRFAALMMAERRCLVRECVSKGIQSEGIRELAECAPGLRGALEDGGYRLLLDAVMDEISLDLRVLFDRRDSMAPLWPRPKALDDLLEILNDPQLTEVWAEDEAIGWVYQYFNDNDVKEMRDAAKGGAPRNSRELAVRNQFFTPRYVVEFLTDNTLGRLWYEMTRGETVLREDCRYLVRRPTEIFLKPGESAPEDLSGSETSAEENLSQEELLRQPVRIPHRPLKDPREIRLLDPACGSMHFGLYAFDLFTVIYDEAWEIAHGPDDDAKSAETFAPFVAFAASFPDKAAFLREVPRLSIAHNIHGIDIDPRAVQIAGLSLWLRAQRAWHKAGVKPADRPRITRANVVCAEPMPGKKELLHEFVEQQFVAGERPVFTFLLEQIFDRMTLAGEAGSLLRIEEEIRTAIADAKRLWKQGTRHEQASLFSEPGEKAGQGEIRLDLSGITDEQFWERAEQRIYDALEAYAEQAETGGGFERRLFAADAAQGFAFIDICRKRYDVVVMNPPFGDCTPEIESVMRGSWGSVANDIYALFLALAAKRLRNLGFIGAITSRGFLVGRDQRDFRPLILGKGEAILGLFVDLGLGVLDAAEVETCCYTIQKKQPHESDAITFHDFRERKRDDLEQLARLLQESPPIIRPPATFHDIVQCSIMYRADQAQLESIGTERSLDPYFGRVTRGLNSSDDERFLRLFWEVPQRSLSSRWYFCAKGAEYMWFFTNICTVVDWFEGGRLIEAHTARISENVAQARRSSRYYFSPAVTFTYRSNDFSLRSLPANCIFTNSAPVIIPKEADDLVLLLAAFLSSKYEGLLKLISKKGKYDTGRVALLPAPDRRRGIGVSREWRALIAYLFRFESRVEASPYFTTPGLELSDDFNANRSIELVVGFAELSGLEPSRLFVERAKRSFVERFSTELPLAETSSSYALGCVFGRWDIRYATGERPAPELPDPFAPLPVCPPGMLQGEAGLPLSPEAGRRLRAEGCYPLDVAWDGILVDDPEHPLDVERRVRAVLSVLWGDRADALEREACALLGIRTLREWFRRPAGFFADHLKRYSKSRRKAPIYWPLSTASGSYTIWLYYHRLTADTLFHMVAEYLEPKLRKTREERLQLEAGQAKEEGRESAKLSKQAGDLLALEQELEEMKVEVLRVAELPYKPDLNDGVQITAAPLWRLFRLPAWRKVLETTWTKLEKGEYDWAQLAYPMWPVRVRKKCRADRSLAIAHGLEDLCEVEAAPKRKRKKKSND